MGFFTCGGLRRTLKEEFKADYLQYNLYSVTLKQTLIIDRKLNCGIFI